MSIERLDDAEAMGRALTLAAQGIGRVEPNPAVGAVILDRDGRLIAEGFHQRFGGPHAEIHALRAAGDQARGGTLFVTLEPCSHVGKTGPCTDAILQAGVARVAVATMDPAPHASGRGIRILRDAGLTVDVGMREQEALRLIAPFATLVTKGRPYVHAKWAMSLDGKIATRTGDSRWISGESSRERVHALRGRMDAIIVGAQTSRRDDPLLTARPAGPRTATRIVVDGRAALQITSQLARTAVSVPVLVATTDATSGESVTRLRAAGVEVVCLPSMNGESRVDLVALTAELGRRQMTNVLVEGGGALLGALFDQRLIDYAHVFIAPKLIGGDAATTALGGLGTEAMLQAAALDRPEIEILGEDVYIHGPLRERG